MRTSTEPALDGCVARQAPTGAHIDALGSGGPITVGTVAARAAGGVHSTCKPEMSDHRDPVRFSTYPRRAADGAARDALARILEQGERLAVG
jgi:hypothetical protein